MIKTGDCNHLQSPDIFIVFVFIKLRVVIKVLTSVNIIIARYSK